MVIEVLDSIPAGSKRFDTPLIEIITDGALDYWNGMKTAGEAAQIIQSRAAIYVAERSG